MDVEVVRPRALKRKASFQKSSKIVKKPRFTRQGTLILPSSKISRLPSPYSMNQGNHGIEQKTIDTDLANLPFDTTGAVTLINGVAQGDDFTNRDGRKFMMTSIYMRAVFGAGQTQVPNNICRYLIVYDRQANGVAPAITAILTAIATTAPNNLNNRDRFVVVYDENIVVGATGANDNQKVSVTKYRKTKLETTNAGTDATAASIQTGALYFVTLGDVVAGTTASKVVAGTIRIRFVEK